MTVTGPVKKRSFQEVRALGLEDPPLPRLARESGRGHR